MTPGQPRYSRAQRSRRWWGNQTSTGSRLVRAVPCRPHNRSLALQSNGCAWTSVAAARTPAPSSSVVSLIASALLCALAGRSWQGDTTARQRPRGSCGRSRWSYQARFYKPQASYALSAEIASRRMRPNSSTAPTWCTAATLQASSSFPQVMQVILRPPMTYIWGVHVVA